MGRRIRTAARATSSGLSLPEALVVALLLGLLGLPAIRAAGRSRASLRVESATRRLALGIEQGRATAQRSGQPCALELGPAGWREPPPGGLPACPGVDQALGETGEAADIRLSHNLPESVRFSSNGLVLDGGTVLVSAEGSDLVRCLVIALPLGVVRQGRWRDAACRPDPLL